MKIALIQEKQNLLYNFKDPDLRFGKDEARRLQKEMVEQNLKLLRLAAAAKADIVLTSEAINYPGQPFRLEEDPREVIRDTQDYLLQSCSTVAKDGKMYVVVGMFRLEKDGKLYNAAVVFDRIGNEILCYHKSFLAGEEKEYLTPGNEFPVWENEYGKIGICVCWDLQFPEIARIYARQGVDLLLCPSWGWENVYGLGRAYENGIYVATAMAIPSYKDIEGRRSPSEVVAPDGRILAQGTNNTPGAVFCTVDDIKDCKDFRELRIGDLEGWISRQKNRLESENRSGSIVADSITAIERGVLLRFCLEENMEYSLCTSDQTWVENIYRKITAKISAECDRIGDKIPYIAENGVYREDKAETDIAWWTNGFWPGILWQLFNATGEEKFRRAAEGVERKLDRAFEQFTGLHHDVGFMWLLSAVADSRITGNERATARGLHAAQLLAGRYNPRGKYIRSWNGDRAGWVIVDSLMNVPLLYWAEKKIGDPRFGYIATDHTDTVMKYVVRPNGSCNHILILDPATGNLLDAPGGQGYGPGSSWSRGQTWAIYGFALGYRYTGNDAYLGTAKKIAHYFLSQIHRTGNVALVDFRAPKEPVYWDSTAGVCAACGLLEIARHVPEVEKSFYTDAAISILRATDEKFCDWDISRDSIVQMGSASYHTEHDRHIPIIYGDYYLIEAILRLLGKDILLW